jgi:hypothetical protein
MAIPSYGAGTWGARTVKVAKPKAPKPSAPVSPYTAPGPDTSWDTAPYENIVSGINQGLGDTKASIINRGVDLGKQYGISYSGDPISGISDLKIDDTSNPFSRAALLKQAYTQSSRGDSNRLAAQGQLYSGAFQNAQNTDTSNFQQGQNSLLSGFGSDISGLLQSYLSANQTAGQQRLDAQGNAIAAAAQTPATPVTYKNIPYAQEAASGIKVSGVDPKTGAFIFVDSKGNVIKGAKAFVKGNKAGITVPRG